MLNLESANEFINQAKGRGSVLGLDCIMALLKQLNNPHKNLRVIHVAGTNGKGSTSAYLSASLTSCGYKVGKFTSPEVFSYYERFQINGLDMSQEDYLKHLDTIKSAYDHLVRKEIFPTVFEIEVALACLYFKSEKCDMVIMECGMGGDTDATNVFDSVLCSVITSIGMDHTAFLGDSIEEIAGHKAGIIKDSCPVVSDVQVDEVSQVLDARASELNTKVKYIKTESISVERNVISYKKYKNINMPLLGSFQINNLCLALECLNILSKEYTDIKPKAVKQGIENMSFPGRFQVISEEPLVILDGCHNLPAALRIKETIEKDFTNKSLTLIMGVLADKEYKKMLSTLLPLADRLFTVTPNNDRALSANMLASEAYKYDVDVKACNSFDTAAWLAKEAKTDIIICLGSLSILKDCRDAFITKEDNNG